MCSLLRNVTADVWMTDEDQYVKLIESHLDTIPEIGVIPSHSLKSGHLVRFRGMIQDMADPVLYLNKYEVTNSTTGSKKVCSGKYKDTLNIEEDEVINEDSPNLQHLERRSVYCVSVPGLNTWARPLPVHDNSIHNVNNAMDTSSSSSQVKRTAEEMDQDVETMSSDVTEKAKRQQKDSNKNDKQVEVLLNHPIQGNNNYSCLVNVYEEIDEKHIKMNCIVDVVGFVSFGNDCDEYSHLPATLVPRLHAVSVKPIYNANPFCPSTLDHSIIASNAEKTRSHVMSVLTKLFLGDSLSAEYVLCNLLSKVYRRNELLTLGHFSVNLTGVPLNNNYTEEVFKILAQVVAKSHYVPMALDNMNSNKFLPEKDYEHNCLKSGVLQLSDHTHLFLDETKLEPGQLNANGVLNLKALNDLVKNQKLDYDFKYVKIEIPVDIPIIVLSEGKSLLHTSVQVIVTPEVGNQLESLSAAKELLKEPILSEIRHYFSVISHLDFNLADELIETIQHDYIKLRQDERKANESDLHLLLILARLISLSYGKTTLTKEMWDKAFDLELFRKERINNREP